jgi:hypothetical protein
MMFIRDVNRSEVVLFRESFCGDCLRHCIGQEHFVDVRRDILDLRSDVASLLNVPVRPPNVHGRPA